VVFSYRLVDHVPTLVPKGVAAVPDQKYAQDVFHLLHVPMVRSTRRSIRR
jgi:hypothetical protein